MCYLDLLSTCFRNNYRKFGCKLYYLFYFRFNLNSKIYTGKDGIGKIVDDRKLGGKLGQIATGENKLTGLASFIEKPLHELEI